MLERTKKQVDKPGASRGNAFPAGTFLGQLITPKNRSGDIERVRLTPHDEIPEFMTSAVNTYTQEPQTPWLTGDMEQTNVWLGELEPVDDDSPDVGDRIFFHSFITADGEVGINDLQEDSNGEGSAIRQENKKTADNIDLFYNLAGALGATYESDKGAILVSEDFCSMLQSGEFETQKVIFTVENFTQTMGANKGEVKHKLVGFEAV